MKDKIKKIVDGETPIQKMDVAAPVKGQAAEDSWEPKRVTTKQQSSNAPQALTDKDFAKKYLNPNRVIRKSSDYPNMLAFLEAANPGLTESEKQHIRNEMAKFDRTY